MNVWIKCKYFISKLLLNKHKIFSLSREKQWVNAYFHQYYKKINDYCNVKKAKMHEISFYHDSYIVFMSDSRKKSLDAEPDCIGIPRKYMKFVTVMTTVSHGCSREYEKKTGCCNIAILEFPTDTWNLIPPRSIYRTYERFARIKRSLDHWMHRSCNSIILKKKKKS